MKHLASEEGSGPISSIGGVMMFLLFLMLTTQLSIHLLALSRASALTLEAATRVARGEVSCDDAATWLSSRVDGYGSSMQVACSGDEAADDVVVVRLSGPSPAPALRGFGQVADVATLSREAIVRRELFR